MSSPNNSKQGLFISFEGIEGAGKSTNINYIADLIEQTGQAVLRTREPGGTELGEAIRELLISKDYPDMNDITELLLMFAARSEHLNRKILPAIQAGTWVLCDRFTDATFAYQGGGRGISTQTIQTLETLVQGEIKPNYTFLFDIDAKQGLQRAQQRGESDRFEQQQLEFFERVRQHYLAMAGAEPTRYKIVDAGEDLPAVQKQINTLLADILMA